MTAGMTAGTEKVPAAGTDPQSSTTPSMSLQTGPGQQPHMETDQNAAAEKMIELLWMFAMATGQGPEMLTELLMEIGSAPGAQKRGFMGIEGISGLIMRAVAGVKINAAGLETHPGVALAGLTGRALAPSYCVLASTMQVEAWLLWPGPVFIVVVSYASYRLAECS